MKTAKALFTALGYILMLAMTLNAPPRICGGAARR